MKKRTPLVVPILWFVVTGIWTVTLCLDFYYNSASGLIALRCLCVAVSLAVAIVHLVRCIKGKRDETSDSCSMTSRRSVIIVVACLLVVILICFMILVPVSSNTAVFTISELRQSSELSIIDDLISFHIADQTNDPAYWETVYTIENRYLLRKSETIYVVPYVTANIENVGTAGTSHWMFNINVLSFSETDTTMIKDWNTARIKDFAFTVRTGANTLITSGVSDFFGDELLLTQEEMKPISPNNYTVTLGVASKDSSGTTNEECQTTFLWNGNITPGAFMLTIPFEVTAAIEYLGNLKV